MAALTHARTPQSRHTPKSRQTPQSRQSARSSRTPRARLVWTRAQDGSCRARSFYGELSVRGSAGGGFEYFLPWAALPGVGFGAYPTAAAARREAERHLQWRLRQIAHHEAAHAVVAVGFGFRMKRTAVELVPVGKQQTRPHGLAHFVGETVMFDGSTRARVHIETGVIVLLAGMAAQLRLGCSYDAASAMAADDLEAARDIIDEVLGYGTPREEWSPWRWISLYDGGRYASYLEKLQLRSEFLLRDRRTWRAIRVLASELLRDGRVSAARVRAVVQAHTGSR